MHQSVTSTLQIFDVYSKSITALFRFNTSIQIQVKGPRKICLVQITQSQRTDSDSDNHNIWGQFAALSINPAIMVTIWTVETIHYLQDIWQDVLWCFPLYGTETHWHFNIMVPIMHSSVHRLWTSSQDWCDSQSDMICTSSCCCCIFDGKHLTLSIWINRGLKRIKGENMGFIFFCSLFLMIEIQHYNIPIFRLKYKDLNFCIMTLVRFFQRLSHISILSIPIIFLCMHYSPSCSLFQSVINYLLRVWIYKLSVHCSCLATLPRGKGRGWVRWVAGYFTKERASKAKMQRSPKVTATHRVSCDIFISEVKNTPSAALSSLCTCTTFRAATVIPSGNIMW